MSRHAPAQTAAPPLRSGWDSSIRCGAVIRTCLPKSPFTSPLYYRAAEPAVPERRDDEPTLAEGNVRLGVTGSAERDQAVAIEVRAPLGALPDVMHLEAVRGEAAALAPPASAIDLQPGLPNLAQAETIRGPRVPTPRGKAVPREAGENEERAATIHQGGPRQERCSACPSGSADPEGGAR